MADRNPSIGLSSAPQGLAATSDVGHDPPDLRPPPPRPPPGGPLVPPGDTPSPHPPSADRDSPHPTSSAPPSADIPPADHAAAATPEQPGGGTRPQRWPPPSTARASSAPASAPLSLSPSSVQLGALAAAAAVAAAATATAPSSLRDAHSRRQPPPPRPALDGVFPSNPADAPGARRPPLLPHDVAPQHHPQQQQQQQQQHQQQKQEKQKHPTEEHQQQRVLKAGSTAGRAAGRAAVAAGSAAPQPIPVQPDPMRVQPPPARPAGPAWTDFRHPVSYREKTYLRTRLYGVAAGRTVTAPFDATRERVAIATAYLACVLAITLASIVVIPTDNDASTIVRTIMLARGAMATGSRLEFVVCDAGSTDETVSSVRRLQAAIAAARIISGGEGHGQRLPLTLDFDLKLLEFERGTSRATRMNAGILRATGHVVLFLYSGIILPKAFDEVIMLTMTAPRARLTTIEPSFFSSLMPGQRALPRSPPAPPLQSRDSLPQWLVSPPKSSHAAAFMGGAFPLASESASHDPFLPILLGAANIVSALLALPLHPAQPFYLNRIDAVDAGGFRDQPVVDAQELLHRIARLPPRRHGASAAATAAPASPSAPRPGSPGSASWFGLRHRRSGTNVAAAGQPGGSAEKSGTDDFAAGGGGAPRFFIAPERAFAALIAAGSGAECLGPSRVFGSLDAPPLPLLPRAGGGGRSAPAALVAAAAAATDREGLSVSSGSVARMRTSTPPPSWEAQRASSSEAQGFFPDEEGAVGDDDDGGDGVGGFVGSRAGPAGAAGVRAFVAHCLCLFLVAGLGMAPNAAFRHVVGDDAAIGGVGADAGRRLAAAEAAAAATAIGTGRKRRRSAGARAARSGRRGTRRRGGELQELDRGVENDDDDDDDDEGGEGSGSRSADGAGFDVDTDQGASEYYLSGRDDSSAWAEPGVAVGQRRQRRRPRPKQRQGSGAAGMDQAVFRETQIPSDVQMLSLAGKPLETRWDTYTTLARLNIFHGSMVHLDVESVTVTVMGGPRQRTFQMLIHREWGLWKFEAAIFRETQIPPSNQRLSLAGKSLEPGYGSLAEVNIVHGSVVRLDLRVGNPVYVRARGRTETLDIDLSVTVEEARKMLARKTGIAFENIWLFRTHSGRFGVFDLETDAHKSTCPLCSKYVAPRECGFYNCMFRFAGLKRDAATGRSMSFKSEWQRAAIEDNYVCFREARNGVAEWTRLVIEVKSGTSVEAAKACPCCLEPLRSTKSARVVEAACCGNDFHATCIDEWSERTISGQFHEFLACPEPLSTAASRTTATPDVPPCPASN
ncbi:hypothetical protein HK405_009477, partial [Cladochytrium tenue]